MNEKGQFSKLSEACFQVLNPFQVPYLCWVLFKFFYSLIIWVQLSSDLFYMSRMLGHSSSPIGNIYLHFLTFLLFSISLVLLNFSPGKKSVFAMGCALFYFMHKIPLSLTYQFHYDIPPVFIFMIVALVESEWGHKSHKSLSEKTGFWPFQLMRLYMGTIYLSAGLAKLQNSGMSWLNGDSLRGSFIERSLFISSEIPMFLVNQPLLCIVLSWLTLLFECFFWLVIFFPRQGLLFWFFAILFHSAIYVSIGLDFSKYFAPTFLAFFPFAFCIDYFSGRGFDFDSAYRKLFNWREKLPS